MQGVSWRAGQERVKDSCLATSNIAKAQLQWGLCCETREDARCSLCVKGIESQHALPKVTER